MRAAAGCCASPVCRVRPKARQLDCPGPYVRIHEPSLCGIWPQLTYIGFSSSLPCPGWSRSMDLRLSANFCSMESPSNEERDSSVYPLTSTPRGVNSPAEGNQMGLHPTLTN